VVTSGGRWHVDLGPVTGPVSVVLFLYAYRYDATAGGTQQATSTVFRLQRDRLGSTGAAAGCSPLGCSLDGALPTTLLTFPSAWHGKSVFTTEISLLALMTSNDIASTSLTFSGRLSAEYR